jgi:CheY-like chemotaxis protein
MARILILDDNACIRELLKEEFAGAGHTIQALGDGESVGDAVAGFKPDLVILDLYMNWTERWDLLAHIKGRFPSLPVIIHTAYDGYRKDPRSLLADGFVIKSICLEELKEQVLSAARRCRVSSFHRKGRMCGRRVQAQVG